MNNSIQHNKFQTIGEMELTETLFKNDGILDLELKTCPSDKTCGTIMPIQIKEACRYLTSKSVFGNRFGDSFTPQIKCPISQGTYHFNMSVNLRPLMKFLTAKMRTLAKLTVFEILPSNRKRSVTCIDLMVNSK